MAVHVGVFTLSGDVSCYYEKEKNTNNFKITRLSSDTVKVNSMYEEIINKINGTLGSICFNMPGHCTNKMRKKVIEEGLKHGFKNVQLIEVMTALYLKAMEQTKYKHINGDIIWIKLNSVFFVWQIKQQKAYFIEHWEDSSDLKNLQDFVKKSSLSRGPDVVLYKTDYDKLHLFKLSAKCKSFSYDAYNFFSDGSLVKARITAGDIDVAHLDTVNFLSKSIVLKLGDINFITFSCPQELPIIYSQKICFTKDSNILEIDEGSRTEELKLPNWKEIYLTFKIDTNEIYSISFSERPEENDIISTENKNTELLKIQDIDISKNYKIPKITTQFDPNINAVGIDLGTSRCCLAVNRKNGIITVPLDNVGERLLPSYVAFDEEMPKCGSIVIERLRHYSKSTVFDSKRIIGRKFGEIEIDTFWPFELCEEDEKIKLGIQNFDEKRTLTAEEVSGTLLKHIKQKAEEFQGKKLTDAVITVPAAFTEAQSNATLEAAKLAGWENVTLLPEPIAAAFAYFMDRPIPNGSNVLLFDLGGGTLDVCIFKIENDQIYIISNTGDTKLGGRDFDTILINYFKNALITKHGITVANKKKYLLMIRCQKIKESLSMLKSGSLDIDDFDPSQDGIITRERNEFQKMAEPLLNKIKNTIQSALFQSKYDPNQIQKVLQVGGGSRMPMIKDLLKEMFPVAEHLCEENPDEVVAIGAAYYAYNKLL